MKIASLSRQGGRPYNEDVFGQWNDGRYVACVVADGAGGHGGGDVAADIARTSVLAGFAAAPGLQARSHSRRGASYGAKVSRPSRRANVSSSRCRAEAGWANPCSATRMLSHATCAWVS